MTDKKLTDEEIVKALECCINGNICSECALSAGNCNEKVAMAFALDLINRQKAEIDDLERIVGMMDNRKYYRKFVDEVYRKEVGNELSDPDFDYIYQLYFDQKAEIEKWKALAENGASAIDTNNRLVQKFAEIKTEAIKEFGKRLKSRINDSVFNYWNNNTGGYYLAEDVPDEIDNLIDEMVGDNNAE